MKLLELESQAQRLLQLAPRLRGMVARLEWWLARAPAQYERTTRAACKGKPTATLTSDSWPLSGLL